LNTSIFGLASFESNDAHFNFTRADVENMKIQFELSIDKLSKDSF